MKKLIAITIVLVFILTSLASCNGLDELVTYDGVRRYLLYDHIIYNGTPYYIVDESPDLSEDGRLVYETIYDVIIVDKDGNPYDEERKEEAWIFPDTDPETIYIYFNSAYYARDINLDSDLGHSSLDTQNKSDETEPQVTEPPVVVPSTTEEVFTWAREQGILASINAEDRPADSTVTRAEFVKMLMTAVYLTPDSEIGQLISEITDSDNYLAGTIPPELNEEYAKLALDYGLLRETDPFAIDLSANITRFDVYVLITRIAGLSYQADQHNNEKNQNSGNILEECSGEIYYLTTAGILAGNDKEYMGDIEVSFEEACILLNRTVDYTEQGYRTDITVKSALVKNDGEYEDYGTIIDTKIIEIDGIKYISFSKFVEIPCEFFPNVGKLKWNRTNLEMYLRYGDDILAVRGGCSVKIADKQVNIRVFRGDIMLPVYMEGEALSYVNVGLMWDNVRATYDDESKVLYVDHPQDDIPLS